MTPETITESLCIDLREFIPQQRHALVFRELDELTPGGFFDIINDHDPKPLYYQIIVERGKIISWDYVEAGPAQWQVRITKRNDIDTPTVGEMAAADMLMAAVFKRFGIDFCCGGKSSLEEACIKHGADLGQVKQALTDATSERGGVVHAFNEWDADFLADYIYNQHHKYYYQSAPMTTELMEKVAGHHGERDPQLLPMLEVYRVLQQELRTHFMKEERVLFPFIRAIANAARNGESTESLPSVTEPIQMMESDHDAAGDLLRQLRSLSDNYTPPPAACNSYKLLYHQLELLEQDLHQHIHLENNILFPKALALQRDLCKNR